MKIFKSYNYSWKQLGVFKLALLTIGVIIGAYFADFVQDYIAVFAAVAAVSSLYIIWVSLRQTER